MVFKSCLSERILLHRFDAKASVKLPNVARKIAKAMNAILHWDVAIAGTALWYKTLKAARLNNVHCSSLYDLTAGTVYGYCT